MASYDNDVWDSDATEVSVSSNTNNSRLKRTNIESARDRDEQLGLEPQYETLKLRVFTSYPIKDLKNKTSLTFSTKNNAIDREPVQASNKDDFTGKLHDMPFDIVPEIHFEGFTMTNLRAPAGLKAEFPTIRANARHSFGTSAQSGSAKNEAVSFTVMPGGAKNSFERVIDNQVLAVTKSYSGLNAETLKKSYGRVKDTNWVDFESPLITQLSEEQQERLEADNKTGVFHYDGDHADLVEAAKKTEEIYDTHVAFSDLNLDRFSFNLSVPKRKVYDKATDLHVEQPQTFYDLALGAAAPKFKSLESLAAKGSVSPSAKKQADELLKEFENTHVDFSAILSFKYAKLVPKFV
jgi:hypothetical protein